MSLALSFKKDEPSSSSSTLLRELSTTKKMAINDSLLRLKAHKHLSDIATFAADDHLFVAAASSRLTGVTHDGTLVLVRATNSDRSKPPVCVDQALFPLASGAVSCAFVGR